MAVGFPTKVNYATGDVLSATNMNDLSGTVNLLESAQYAAGKNKIINGDFGINQRAFTTTTTSLTYGFDRFKFAGMDGTTTYSAQTFTPGAAPVTGYEATNFARIVSAGQTLPSAASFLIQAIESVRTLANQTTTVSFWAKAATGTPKIAIELDQQFGTAGSTRVTTYAGQVTISTSWTRYSVTILVPSISGKTIGTANDSLTLNLWTSAGTDFNARTGSIGIQSATIDIWGVQVEAGSTASPFQTATGTKQGELAACQRYYYRNSPTVNNYGWYGNGYCNSTTIAKILWTFPVTMRIPSTTIEYGGTLGLIESSKITTVSSLAGSDATLNTVCIQATVASGLTTDRTITLLANNSLTSYIGISAEL